MGEFCERLRCEHCNGVLRERLVRREMFRVKDAFVILERVPVRVCTRCGSRVYRADVVHRAHELARKKKTGTTRHESVVVAPYTVSNRHHP